ncbi:hypothetical protein LOAG_10878, partial [Loa loa]
SSSNNSSTENQSKMTRNSFKTVATTDISKLEINENQISEKRYGNNQQRNIAIRADHVQLA